MLQRTIHSADVKYVVSLNNVDMDVMVEGKALVATHRKTIKTAPCTRAAQVPTKKQLFAAIYNEFCVRVLVQVPDKYPLERARVLLFAMILSPGYLFHVFCFKKIKYI